MTVKVHGILNPMIGTQGGTLVSEGTGTNPLVTKGTSNSDGLVRFGVRLVPDLPQRILSLDYTANDNTAYTFSAGSESPSFACAGFFNKGYEAQWVLGKWVGKSTDRCWHGNAEDWLKIKSNKGVIEIAGYTLAVVSGKEPSSWTVTDETGTILDVQGSTPIYFRPNEVCTFMLPQNVTTQELTFTFKGGTAGVSVSIQLILAGEPMPAGRTLTVEAQGTNASKWSFGVPTIQNIVKTAKSDMPTSEFNKITNGILDESPLGITFYAGYGMTVIFPTPVIIVGVALKTQTNGGGRGFIVGGSTITLDKKVVATYKNTTQYQNWNTTFDPVLCTSLGIFSKEGDSTAICLTELEVWAEVPPTEYVPTLVLEDVNLKDANKVIYAKRVVSIDDPIGNDLSTKFKVTCS